MYYFFKKIYSVVVLILFSSTFSYSQMETRINHTERDDMPFYFGMTLGYSNSFLHYSHSPMFVASDSIMVTDALSNKGVSIGLMGAIKLNNHFDFRFNPQLNLSGYKTIAFTLDSTKLATGIPWYQVQKLPTTIVSLPLQLKFNSDRIGNFKVYLFGGLKYDIDLSYHNQERNDKSIIHLNKYDWGIEGGIGFSFYLPAGVISPEIKFSDGLSNLLQKNPALNYSNVFDKIQSRMIVFSICIEN
jgi:hypothetical protein